MQVRVLLQSATQIPSKTNSLLIFSMSQISRKSTKSRPQAQISTKSGAGQRARAEASQLPTIDSEYVLCTKKTAERRLRIEARNHPEMHLRQESCHASSRVCPAS